MSGTNVIPGQLARGVFVVYDGAGVPITGLVQSDFAVLVAHDGANSSETIVISEIGSGRYGYTFTPPSGGDWYIVVRSGSYNARGWQEEFSAEVTARGGAGGIPALYVHGDWRDQKKRIDSNRNAVLLSAIAEAEDDDDF